MNIWTWNVNSIRSKISKVNELLKKHDIDILIITETKMRSIHEEGVTRQIDPNYIAIWNSNQTSYYHGVGILHKKTLQVSILSNYLSRSVTEVDTSLCSLHNQTKVKQSLIDQTKLIENMKKAQQLEGRILTIKCSFPDNTNDNIKEIVIVGTYVPNSGVSRGDPLRRLGYRVLVWDKDMYTYLRLLEQKYKNVIWIGDLNVARKDNDMNRNARMCAGTTPEERQNISNFLKESEWVDTWDYFNQGITDYHHRWTYGMGKGRKLRLDYILCSSQLKDFIYSSMIDHYFTGSDHVPVGTKFKW